MIDAISDGDLLVIGEALQDAPLLTGGSGIALGLPRNLIRAGLAQGGRQAVAPVAGPSAILAGSCSGATRGQVERHAEGHPTLRIDVAQVMAGGLEAGDLVAFIAQNQPTPQVYSSGTPEEVADLQQRYGREAVAAKLDALFAETARQLVGKGYRRIVVAGGETWARWRRPSATHWGPGQC